MNPSIDCYELPRLSPPTFALPPSLLSKIVVTLENPVEVLIRDSDLRLFKLIFKGSDHPSSSTTDPVNLAYTIWYSIWDVFGSKSFKDLSSINVSFEGLKLSDDQLKGLIKELWIENIPDAGQKSSSSFEFSKSWWFQRYPIFCYPNLSQSLLELKRPDNRVHQVEESGGGGLSSEGSKVYDGLLQPVSNLFSIIRTSQQDLPKPPEPIYERFIHHLNSYVCLSIYGESDEDLKALNKWLNDPRVDEFWKDSGSLEKHVGWLKERYEDKFVLPVLGSYRGTNGRGKLVIEPFGYFEIYWASESKISKVYETDQYDRGIHMLVGSNFHRGPHRVKSWLPSLLHYIFSSQSMTNKVLSEPDHRNLKMINYLKSFGFFKAFEVDLGHKVAAIMVLERDHFWNNCPL